MLLGAVLVQGAELSALSCGLRYDHFSVLCELLPVGIPSLAVCLQSLLHGKVPCSPRGRGLGRGLPQRFPTRPRSLNSRQARRLGERAPRTQ